NATGIVNGLTSTELGASWLLPRLIGASAAFDLLLTGRVVEADEARSMGLVSKVVEKDEALAHALSLAGQMCRFSTYGLQQTKAVLWANLETAGLESAIALEDRAQLLLGFTDNLPEAIRARQQGRAPVYTDEPRTS
ncbi:MAG: enoyl-CoA hydratase, partial [Acidimicrobiia bacterium]|nr:enoyl-CoA hydratase [Acidimicrobiia bacterium]